MTASITREQLVSLMAEIADVDIADSQVAETKTLAQLGIDSLELVAMVAAVEDRLNTTVFLDDIQSSTPLGELVDRVLSSLN
jgi:acyl carrier protein